MITKEMIGATSFSFPSFGGGSNGEETFHPFHSFALGHYARQREGKVEGRKRVNQRVFLGESIRRHSHSLSFSTLGHVVMWTKEEKRKE